jgi:hypothetical protein
MFTAAKLWQKGEPFCIQITGFPTNISDWKAGMKRARRNL